MLTDEQKAIRKNGIGASEVAAAVGLCPYRTPLRLYREKIGEMPEPEETWAMWLGTALEPAILKMYAREMKVATIEQPGTLVHPTEPWMMATPDGLATLADGTRVVIECKRSAYKRPDWGKAWTSDVPITYACQCLWLMAVLRARGEPINEAHVAAFFRGDEFQIFVVPFDAGRVEWLQEKARAFWLEHVVARRAPEERDAA